VAGASFDSSDDHETTSVIAAINITPFVDVVLVLLVIFMVTAPALVKEVMEIHLPKTASGDGQVIQTFGVAVNREGHILLNGVLIDDEVLRFKIKEALAQSKDLQAIISADTDVAYGRVVKVIDLLKTAGLVKFAVQIEHDKSIDNSTTSVPSSEAK
jgi:biopolymer transport protein ExbD